MFGPASFIKRCSLLYPNRLALVSMDKTYTYRQIDELSDCFARGLVRRGVKQGDRVAYLLGNNPASVVTYQAIQRIGAVAAPINKRLLGLEIGDILRRVKAAALVFDDDVSDKVRAAVYGSGFEGLLVLVGSGRAELKAVPWAEVKDEGVLAGGEDVLESVVVSPADESLILFSSSSTGAPKAAMRTAETVSMLSYVQVADGGEDQSFQQVVYTQAPLYHLGGFLCMLKVMATGSTLVMESHFNPERIFSLVEQYGVTQLYMIPPVLFSRLAVSEARRGRSFPAVRQAQCAGGRTTPHDVDAIFDLFPNCRLRVSFGSTESGAVSTAYIDKQGYLACPSLAYSAGFANMATEIRLESPDGQEVKAGEVGELLVRSPMLFSGYLDDAGVCQRPEALRDDGFFETGDLMIRNQQGLYVFMDRLKDMVKTGGENVCATTVESVVCQYPGIAECAVIGVPDEMYGEGVAAAVVMEAGVSPVDGRDLREFCRSYLSGFSIPRYVGVMDELPRNSVGKVQKRALKEMTDLFILCA